LRYVAAIVLAPALAAAQPLPPVQPPIASGAGSAPAPLVTARRGFTFEANLGIGFTHADFDGESRNTDVSLAGMNITLAGWVKPRLAVGLRIAGVQLPDEDGDGGPSERTINVFAGFGAQYWFDDHLWAGGGIGFATFRPLSDSDTDAVDGVDGFGFDLRAGYSIGRPGSNNTLNVSIELNPCFYSNDVTDGSLTNFAFLLGYQFL
jgi:hypothetical protein